MQVSGEFKVSDRREELFNVMNNAKLLAGCIPGCSNLEEVGDNRYSATLQVEVSFLKPKFQVQVELVEIQPPERLKATINGKPIGLPGKLTATAELLIEEEVDASKITWRLDQSLTGKLGSIGQSVIRSKAVEQGELFVANLTKELEIQGLGVNS